MYVLYALLINIFTLFVFTDHYLHKILDKYVKDETVENQYFDHIVGKYVVVNFTLFLVHVENNEYINK